MSGDRLAGDAGLVHSPSLDGVCKGKICLEVTGSPAAGSGPYHLEGRGRWGQASTRSRLDLSSLKSTKMP